MDESNTQGEVKEGESPVKIWGAAAGSPLGLGGAIFFLGGVVFFAEGLAALMAVGFGFFP
jgi:hypothetical protein